MDEGRLLEQFVAEAEELIDSLRADLDELERQRAVGRIQPDLLNRVFRNAHSLKGIAGMAGVSSVQRVAHRFEDLLDDLRMGRIRPDTRTFPGGHEVAEGLATLVGAAARRGDGEEEAARLVVRIDELRKVDAVSDDEAEAAFVELDDRVRQTLTEYEEHRLAENVRERRPVYEARVAFHLTEFDTGYRAFAARLATLGEIVCTLPGTGGDDPMRIAFRIVFASSEPRERLAALAGEHGGQIVLISRYPEPEPEEQGATDALEPLSASVRVDMRAVEALATRTGDLAIRVAEMASEALAMAERLGLSAREAFDVKQRARAIERGFAELEERIVDLRLVPLDQTFVRARRLVLATAAELGRDVELEAEGGEVRLDKAIADRIAEPLSHLLRNAVGHGVEPPEVREAAGKPRAGRVRLRAEPFGNRVRITVADDGPGIDTRAVRRAARERGIALMSGEERVIDAIFEPGLSTAETIDTVSGRGVGLDAVAAVARELGGEISVESEPGRGTSFHVTVPSTLVMISAVFVEAAGAIYAIDVNQIDELAFHDVPGARRLAWRDGELALHDLARLVRAGESTARRGRRPCLIARAGERRVAVAVDRFAGQREVIVKSLGRYAAQLEGVAGAIDLEGGRVALLIDLAALVAHDTMAEAAG
jgi:two-component system chemotaxis sensor kinase CheA